AQTVWIQKHNFTSLAGFNLTVDSPRSVGIPTGNCGAGHKVYSFAAIGGSTTFSVIGEASATLLPGDRYFVKQNSGDESTVSCGGVSYLKVNVSKKFWIQKNAGGTGDPAARTWHGMANNGNASVTSNRSYVFGGTNLS